MTLLHTILRSAPRVIQRKLFCTLSLDLQFAFGFSWHVLQSSCLQLFSFSGLDLTRACFMDCPALSTTRIFNSASLSAFWHCFANSLFGVESTKRTVSYPPFAYHVFFFSAFSLSLLPRSQDLLLYIGHSPFLSFSMILSNFLLAFL